jgi:predicted dehydrogenase
VAVVGAGSFGKNHARVYHELQEEGIVEFCGIVDADLSRAQEHATKYRVPAFSSVDELLRIAHPDAASVAVPTVHHASVAQQLMESGVDVLIEKPIAATLREAQELIKTAEKHRRIGMVGHLERFNPAVRATVPLITVPMFFEVHRLSVFTPRALDVDVVLDLMIHDLDIVLSLVKSPIKEIRAVGLPILSPKVDICNVRVEFESGCVANFTASRVSTERVRKLRFFQPRQYISVDYGRQDVLVFTVGETKTTSKKPETIPGKPGLFDSTELSAARELFSGAAILAQSGIRMEKPPVTAEEPLKSELKAFLSAVSSRSTPEVTLEEGKQALALGLSVLEQVNEHSEKFKLTGLSRSV